MKFIVDDQFFHNSQKKYNKDFTISWLDKNEGTVPWKKGTVPSGARKEPCSF
jgi:hypothetical protein